MKKWLLILIVLINCHLSYTTLLSTTICPNDTIVYLNIPDRRQGPGSPPEGWCGETSIQMAALYYGAFIPQRIIHALPNPVHPDLYSNDIPIALYRIGLYYTQYSNSSLKTVADYIEWIKDQLDQHYPVLIGCKIYPTNHPDWNLDHFMIAVGYTQDKLIYNTTWGYQEAKSFEELSTIQNGISFENQQRYYYGISIKGFDNVGYGLPVNIFPLNETPDSISIQIRIGSLNENNEYQLLRFDDINKSKQPISPKQAVQVQTFRSNKSYHEITNQIPIDSTGIFRCIAATQTSINGKTGIYRNPEGFVLYDNYPNPFNPSTIIQFKIPMVDALNHAEVHTTLKVYDLLGREIATLLNENKSPGSYAVEFNGSGLSSGPYYAVLHSGNFTQSRKIMLIK